MPRLKSKKTFPFRQFAGREPTIEELRQELEEMYTYLVNQVDETIEEVRAEIPSDES
jgi:hypothetical protein